MGNVNDKYGRNRNLWRRVYGPVNRPPNIQTIIDPVAEITYSLDLSKVNRDRSYYYIVQSQVTSSVGLVLGEYDEGLITFSGQSEKSFNFSFTFSGTPYVVFTRETANETDGGNINIFGFSVSTTGSHMGVSIPFYGTVRYRACYAPSYPYFFQSPTVPASGVFRASAGSLVPNASYYTASYSALGGAPTKFLQSVFDSGYTYTADVMPELSGSAGASSAISELSAHTTTPVHFIAYE